MIFSMLILLCTVPLTAQKKSKKKKKGKTEIAEKKDDKDVLAKSKKKEGLFPIFQDSTNGTAYMEISEDQLDKEFIYFSYTENGPIWAGHVKGLFRGNKVFKIRKHYEQIEFVTQNTNFYIDENSALSRAKDANISEAIMVSSKIEKTSKDKKKFYIKADDLFLTEKVQKITPRRPDGPMASKFFNLGKLSKEKTKYRSIRNYPENTEFVVDYVFENASPKVMGGPDITDARYTTITYQHTIIEMPVNDFEVRYDDPRVGYFTQSVTDLGSTSFTPYRDLIRRWHLVKKDSSAALSEPVEPIVWWIENTTPKPFRPVIKDAVLQWNKAFEKAGFKNAIQVKQQPDDAEWDAGDIRYNVLRWTSSPFPPWGGYGPSFTNPRTGQILGADIMLEMSFIKGDLLLTKLFGAEIGLEGLGTGEELFNIPDLFDSHNCGTHCSASSLLQLNNLVGKAWVKSPSNSLDYDDVEVNTLIDEALHYLLMHEVGHTFGLNHNMRASNLHSPAEINNKSVTEKIGLYGSVMDYPAINLALDKSQQGNYYTVCPGPYDMWAIEFGYSQGLEDKEKEQERLNEILNRSTEKALAFGNDADDMRAPGKAIDPRVNVGDLTNDPIAYGLDRIKLIKNLLPELKEKFVEEGNSYQPLVIAYNSSTGQLYSVFSSVSRFIGGVYVDRAFAGQEGATQPYTPVPYTDQKRAMKLLTDHLFSPTAFDEPKELYNYLQRQRRGFNFFSSSEDPKLNERFSLFYNAILTHVLHPNVLKRMTNSELYGNEYSVFEMTSDLTDAIFKADLGSEVNIYRQNMQIDYVKQLIKGLASTAYDDVAKSSLLYQLQEVKKMTTSAGGSGATKAHRNHIDFLIGKALDKGK